MHQDRFNNLDLRVALSADEGVRGQLANPARREEMENSRGRHLLDHLSMLHAKNLLISCGRRQTTETELDTATVSQPRLQVVKGPRATFSNEFITYHICMPHAYIRTEPRSTAASGRPST